MADGVFFWYKFGVKYVFNQIIPTSNKNLLFNSKTFGNNIQN